jgi:hypothetical protein
MSEMQDLSPEAAAILASMESDRAYDAADLKALFSNTSMDSLREIMHELWLNRCVERFGYTGWRRQRSTCASKYAPDPRSCASCPIAPGSGHGIKQTAGAVVRLDQLVERPPFDGMFK